LSSFVVIGPSYKKVLNQSLQCNGLQQPPVNSGCGGIVLVATLLTISSQSIRAALTNPVNILRGSVMRFQMIVELH
jgi:hypothetical protein